MKKIITLFIIIFFVVMTLSTVQAKEYKVAIFDFDVRERNQPTVAKHIEKQLKNTGLKFKKIEHFTGRDSEITSLRVLKRLDEKNYDLIITITSDSMVPATHALKKTPWLFTNINNPRFFGIRDSLNPGSNKSGVTYYVPVAKQIKFFNEVLNKKLKKIGVIFDYYAKSRRAELVEFREASLKLHINYEIKLIKEPEELKEAAKELLNMGVEAIIVTSSGKLYNNIDLILEITNAKNIPIFSVNKKGVANGALSAIASDYYKMVDENLIPMAIDVLKNGINPGHMPVQYLKKPFIYLNLTQAKVLNLEISDTVKERASKKY